MKLAVFFTWLCLICAPLEAGIEADVLFKGGTIYDGTGEDPYVGDVAVRNRHIVAVGEFEVDRADYVIDCRGLAIAPGFIDLHNHSDSSIVRPRTRGAVNYLTQGCTTIVTGNCGSGPIDVGDYYQRIEDSGAGVNVAHLLPQGALRGTVIGNDQRRARDEDIERMKALTEKAMRDGAWGMSTGLIYVPSSYADTDELVAIAEVVAQHGGIYASHIRGEGTVLLSSVSEALLIGRRADLPVHISHFKSSGRDAWGLIRQAAAMIEKAREKGQPVTADQYPYIASSTSLRAILVPPWARSGGRDALVGRLDSPIGSRDLVAKIAENLEGRNGGDAVQIARCKYHPDWVGKTLAEIAKQEDREPLGIALEIIRNGGASIVSFSMSEEDVRFAMKLPWVATASDGRVYIPGPDQPHPRSYGTFVRKLGHYSKREGVIPLKQAVRSSSGLPADILGLKDRGYLKKDFVADIAVFEPDKLRDNATFTDSHQYSTGMRFVLVGGEFAIARGVPTGILAGRPLRHSSPQQP